MIASLMMYHRPELTTEIQQYWSLIREHLLKRGVDSPMNLSQNADELEVWNNEDLVLSQTCGMPYRTWLHDKVSLIGTPDFGLDACEPGFYRSAIVVHKDNPKAELTQYKHSRFAYNQTFSQSGYAAPYWHTTPLGFWFDKQMQTGGHLASAQAVAEKQVDIAALDAVTWRLIQQYEAFSSELRVLDWTTPTPGLPYIAAANANTAAIFSALQEAIASLPDMTREKLGIRSLVKIPKSAYLSIQNPLDSF